MDLDPKPVVIRLTDDGTAQTGGRGIFLGNHTMTGHQAIHTASVSSDDASWRLVSVKEGTDNTVWMRFEEMIGGAVEALLANVEHGVILNIEAHPALNIELRSVLVGMSESEMARHLMKLGWKKIGLARGFVFFTREIRTPTADQ